MDGDAEGNAEVFNERGVSVNGEDCAGFHTFSPDAGLVVYGDYGVTASPHLTNTIRARETLDGTSVWSVELDRTFGALNVTDARVIVSAPPETLAMNPWDGTEYIDVFDASSGEHLRRIPTVIDIRHLS